MGLPPRPAREELARATERWQAGTIQAPEFDAWVERSRSAFARINGVDPATVAIGANVSSFVGLVAASLPRAPGGGLPRRLRLGAVPVHGPRRP